MSLNDTLEKGVPRHTDLYVLFGDLEKAFYQVFLKDEDKDLFEVAVERYQWVVTDIQVYQSMLRTHTINESVGKCDQASSGKVQGASA